MSKLERWGEKISVRQIISSDLIFNTTQKNLIFQLAGALRYFLSRLLNEHEDFLFRQKNKIKYLINEIVYTETLMQRSLQKICKDAGKQN